MTLLDKYYNRNTATNMTDAEKIAFNILADIKGRSGLEDAFNECDEDIQEEIIQEWIDIAQKGIDDVYAVKEYNNLLDDSLQLNALENAGVDNWDGYAIAMEDYNEENPDE